MWEFAPRSPWNAIFFALLMRIWLRGGGGLVNGACGKVRPEPCRRPCMIDRRGERPFRRPAMPYLTLSRAALGVSFILCLQLAPVQAQPFVNVATTGTNVGGCGSVTSPCRTFQYMHDQTTPGFTIVALDSGDFGVITITKSIAILAAGSRPQGGPAPTRKSRSMPARTT